MHLRSLEGREGQVTLKYYSSSIHNSVERAVKDWHRVHMGSEVVQTVFL